MTAAGDTDPEGPGSTDDRVRYRRAPFRRQPRQPLLHRAVPVTAQLDGYGTTSLRRDVVAGLTVAALAIPSAMGFAEVAGLPPVTGLYALLLPVAAYALLGTSRQLVVGPEGTSAALVATAVAPLAAGDPARYIPLAALLAVLVGIGFLLARGIRLGWVADYLSRAALVGFVHGVAVVLICGQLAKLTGVAIDADRPGRQVLELLASLDEVSVTTLATGVLAILTLVALKRWVPKAPAPLIVAVGAIAVSGAADLADHGVALIGDIPQGLPSFALPELRLRDALQLALPAAGIVFATYSDSILTARSFAGRHRQHVDADQELFALGVANLTAGATQAFPMGNSNSRTVVNDAMGVRTQVAGLVSVAVVALVLVALTDPVELLPAAVLGAVIVVAAAGLVDLGDWRALRRVARGDVVIALAATLGVVALGILQGIIIAVVLSIIDVIRRSARPHDAVLGWVPRLGRYGDVAVHPSAEVVPGVLVYRLDDRLFFANADYVKGRIREAIAGAPAPVDWFVFDAETLAGVDSTGVAAIEDLVRDLAQDGTTLVVARLKAPVATTFEDAGLTARIGAGHFFGSVREAVAARPDRSGGSGPQVLADAPEVERRGDLADAPEEGAEADPDQ